MAERYSSIGEALEALFPIEIGELPPPLEIDIEERLRTFYPRIKKVEISAEEAQDITA